jgi:hypothetical protein
MLGIAKIELSLGLAMPLATLPLLDAASSLTESASINLESVRDSKRGLPLLLLVSADSYTFRIGSFS